MQPQPYRAPGADLDPEAPVVLNGRLGDHPVGGLHLDRADRRRYHLAGDVSRIDLDLQRDRIRLEDKHLGRFVDRPIVDLTNLDGRYDIKFAVAQEDYMPMLVRSAVNAGVTLPPQALAALDLPSMGSVENGLKSLGLVITPRRSPLDVLVVDSIAKAPTDN